MDRQKQDIPKTLVSQSILRDWMINDVKYAFPRDNGLASWSCIDNIEATLPMLGQKERINTEREIRKVIFSRLLDPKKYGAQKHKVSVFYKNQQVIYEDASIHTEDVIATDFISDYEFKQKRLIVEKRGAEHYEDLLTVDPGLCFEDEHDWCGLLSFLSTYSLGKIEIDKKPIAVSDKRIYQWMLTDARWASSAPHDGDYAVSGEAPNCVQRILIVLPNMSEDFRQATARQLIEETISALSLHELHDKDSLGIMPWRKQWIKLIQSLAAFVGKGWRPYNDTDCKYGDWGKLTAADQKEA